LLLFAPLKRLFQTVEPVKCMQFIRIIIIIIIIIIIYYSNKGTFALVWSKHAAQFSFNFNII
jgi:hypothetical protein